MRLWDDRIDAMRESSRRVVDAGLPGLMTALDGTGDIPEDPLEMLELRRRAYAARYQVSDRAVDRELAGIRCRVFEPEGEPSAVYLHFHGGGMVLGAPEMNDQLNADLCARFGLVVVSVDYRLAPEHIHPAGPDDGLAVARWVIDHAGHEWGTERIILAGESAGAFMAAIVALRLRDEGATSAVIGANLVFGIYDWGRSPSQRGVRPSDAPDMLTPESCLGFAEWYLPGLTDDERRDPQISPAFAPLHDLPAAFFTVGTADHLLDDTLMLSTRWAAAGNEVDLFVAPDMPHGFYAFPCEMAYAWQSAFEDWLARRLGP